MSGKQVTAVAYDNPIPGYGTNNTINLRLWAAKPDTEFDLEAFNTGDYIQVRQDWALSSSHNPGLTSSTTDIHDMPPEEYSKYQVDPEADGGLGM